jgi:hypothetical protein
MLSRREESPARTPTVLIGKRARDASLRLSMTGEGLDDSANVRELSPFSGLRLGSPGIYPRAGWTERTANAWQPCSPGRGRGNATFKGPRSVSPGRAAGTTPHSRPHDPFPRPSSGRQSLGIPRSVRRSGAGRRPARGSTTRSPLGGAGAATGLGFHKPLPSGVGRGAVHARNSPTRFPRRASGRRLARDSANRLLFGCRAPSRHGTAGDGRPALARNCCLFRQRQLSPGRVPGDATLVDCSIVRRAAVGLTHIRRSLPAPPTARSCRS